MKDAYQVQDRLLSKYDLAPMERERVTNDYGRAEYEVVRWDCSVSGLSLWTKENIRYVVRTNKWGRNVNPGWDVSKHGRYVLRLDISVPEFRDYLVATSQPTPHILDLTAKEIRGWDARAEDDSVNADGNGYMDFRFTTHREDDIAVSRVFVFRNHKLVHIHCGNPGRADEL